MASAIYAGTKDADTVDIMDLEDRLYRAVNAIGFGSDEAKADLYAQVADRLTADTTFKDAVSIIELSMDETAKYLPGGI